MAPSGAKVVIDLLDSDSDDAKVPAETKPPTKRSTRTFSKPRQPPRLSKQTITTTNNVLDDDPITTSQPFSSPNPSEAKRADVVRNIPLDLISLSSEDGGLGDLPSAPRSARTAAQPPPSPDSPVISSENELENLDSMISSSQKDRVSPKNKKLQHSMLSLSSSSKFAGMGFSSRTLEILAGLNNTPDKNRDSTTRSGSKTSSRLSSSKELKTMVMSNSKKLMQKTKTDLMGFESEDDVEEAVNKQPPNASSKALDKANKKRQREEEQAARKKQKAEERANAKRQKDEEQAITSVNKLKQSHTETVKEMTVEISASLFGAPVGERLQAFLDSLGVAFESYEQPVDGVVTWSRTVSSVWDEEQGIFLPGPTITRKEYFVLILVNAAEFATFAADDDLLDSHVLERKQLFKGYKVIYLIEGLAKYIKKKETEKTRAFTQAVRNRMDSVRVGRSVRSSLSSSRGGGNATVFNVDCLEDALLRLQVIHGCLVFQSVAYLDSAEVISTYTQHISSVPYKKARSNISKTTNFCMDVGQVKSGTLPSEIYGKMLQEVQMCTTSVADTISRAFPSVPKLYSAFQLSGDDVLKTLPVSSRNTGLSTGRALGPAMSKRMAKVWTSTNEWELES